MLRKHGDKMKNLCFALCHVNENRLIDFHPPKTVLFEFAWKAGETAMRLIFEFVFTDNNKL